MSAANKESTTNGNDATRTPLDIDQFFEISLSQESKGRPWKLCYIALNNFEPNWSQMASTPGVCVLRKLHHDFLEVAVDESYFQWLPPQLPQYFDRLLFKSYFSYDPTQQISFDDAFKVISSRHSQGLSSCLRSIIKPELQVAFEWAVLKRDILTSDLQVQKLLTEYIVPLTLKDERISLVILANLQDLFEKPSAFRGDDFSRVSPGLPEAVEYQDTRAELQIIGKLRTRLMLAGGPHDLHQFYRFD